MPEASSEGILEIGRLRHGSAAREPPGMQTRFNIPGCFGPTLSLSLSLSLASGGARISVSSSHYSHLLPCDWEACGAHHHIQYSGTLCGLSMWLQPLLRIRHPYLSDIWQGLQLRADTETTRVTMR
jgi:hypothetical protein